MVIPSFVAGLSNITEFMVSNQSVLIVGGIMRKLGEKADPKVVNELLVRQLLDKG